MAARIDDEDFRWAFSISRIDVEGAPILQYFDRLNGPHGAKQALELLKTAYPEIPFQIFFCGDYLFAGDPANYQTVH